MVVFDACMKASEISKEEARPYRVEGEAGPAVGLHRQREAVVFLEGAPERAAGPGRRSEQLARAVHRVQEQRVCHMSQCTRPRSLCNGENPVMGNKGYCVSELSDWPECLAIVIGP